MLYAKPSKIRHAGVGVFTTASIRKNSRTGLPLNDYKIVRAGTVHGRLRKYCLAMWDGTLQCPKDPHKLAICWFLNHSEKPTVDCKTWRAARHIRAGEELTINYDDLERFP
jgi:hypothetical protein